MRILLPLFVLLAGCAHHGAPVAQTPIPTQNKPAVQAKNWADRTEYELANAAFGATDAAARLARLDKWAADYPKTDYIDERHDMYLSAYQDLKQTRQAFDMAQEILKTRPANFRALAAAVSTVTGLKPSPTPADLDAAEGDAFALLDNPGIIDAAKPRDVPEAEWAKTVQSMKPFAEQALVSIYAARKDEKRAVNDLTKLLQRDPSLAAASYRLASAMLNVIKDEQRPQDQPAALYQFARAASYNGPNALPAESRKQVEAYLTQAYAAFYGSAEGLQQLLATAKDNPFPPASYRGVALTPLDAATVDDVLRSSNATTRASITFLNQSKTAVDIYWISYNGERVLYRSGLAPGAGWEAQTFLSHPWLVVASGSGGTTEKDTGIRLAGFEALTSNGDTAVIVSPVAPKAAKR